MHAAKRNEEVFTEIYETNHWGSPESASGPGAELRQTEKARVAVASVLDRYDVRTLVDIGCGDVNWVRRVADLHRLTSYVGLDIVPALIRSNQASFNDRRFQFACIDFTTDSIPQADLALCRDVLVHLSHRDAQSVLTNIASSQSRYLLTTTYVDIKENRDNSDGHWRPINLQAAPFHLPPPVEYFDTCFTDNGRHHAGNGLGLWKLNQLPACSS